MEITDLQKEKIISHLKSADAMAYKNTNMEYRVYIDTDGEVGVEEWPAGSNSYYKFPEGYERIYIHAFCHEYFSIIWDYWFEDSGLFIDAVEEHFGEKFQMSENDTLYYDGLDTCEKSGHSEAEYCAWLDSCEAEAIKELQNQKDYEEIYYEWIKEQEENA